MLRGKLVRAFFARLSLTSLLRHMPISVYILQEYRAPGLFRHVGAPQGRFQTIFRFSATQLRLVSPRMIFL